MKLFSFSIALALACPAAVAWAERPGETSVFAASRAGRILPLPEIERRVIPQIGGAQYLGIDFDMDSGIYTLKFLRNGNVIWVDVDGRSGQIVSRSDR